MNTSPIPAAQRVRDALAFEPVVVAGVTFVPTDAVAALRWGVGSKPELMALVCSHLHPDFVFIPASEPWAAEAVDRVIACGTAPFWVVSGPFGTVAHRDGWNEALKTTFADPASIGQRMGEVMPDLTEQIRRGARLGVTAIVIAEDLAGSDGPLVAPDFALDQIVPRIGRLAEAAAEYTLPAVFHSDGDVRWVLPSLRRRGFAAVHPGGLTDPVFDVFVDAAHSVGLVVIGGLSRETLHAGGPAVVRAATRVSIRAASGGLLIADDGGVTTSEELGSLVSALQLARVPSRHGGLR